MTTATPELGTLSEGTMRPEDLIPRFMDALGQYAPHRADALRAIYPVTIQTIETGTPPEHPSDLHEQAWEHRHETAAQMLLDDLFEALNEIAPEGAYFGAHEGDGADYGFWPAPEED
jgi:hypothetical protein